MSHITLYSVDSSGAVTAQPEITFMSFPGGERHVRLPKETVDQAATAEPRNWTLRACVYTPADIMDLLLVTNALQAISARHTLKLQLPYVPYARQDRIAITGEPLSIKVFANLVNSLGFDEVEIWDPHSDVTPALLNNVRIVPTAKLMQAALGAKEQTALLYRCAFVAPDAGARKRVAKLAQDFGTEVVFADKVRDPKTGVLSQTQVLDRLPNKPLLVVDDICDGGGTFIQLAKVLREKTQQPLYLYVTHGLFTKGLEPLLTCYDQIFTANCKDQTLVREFSAKKVS